MQSSKYLCGILATLTIGISGCGPSVLPSVSNTTVTTDSGSQSGNNTVSSEGVNANSTTGPVNSTGSSQDHPSTSNTTGNDAPGNNSTSDNTTSVPPSPPPTTPSDEDLVAYTGPVQHIFFHPLIAYPKRAFDGDSMTQGFNDWFVTVPEFTKMVDALYKDNFILIDVRDMLTITEKNGTTVVEQKQLKLPKGKKPLIISIDDMNYYKYMQQNGTINRLVVDSQGNIAAESTDDNGQTVLSYDNEIVPILDAFVREHPDFSFHGEKGMINLTGYQGVLGYRTNELTSPNYNSERAGAVKVINALKADGWTFASHGYGHLEDATISYQTFVADTDRWMKEVEPLVGPTPVYVYPFGSRVPTNGDKWQYLIHSGFHILLGVGPTTYVQWTPAALMMDRRHIDGISLHSQRSSLLDLFDSNQIIDPSRPPKY